MPRPRLSLLAAAFALAHSACFLGYDSRWGETKRAQQHAAKAATPESLHADDAKTSTGLRTLRVRLHATPAYAQTTVDWQKQARDVVDEANRMLGPAVGVRLDVKDATSWTPTASEQDLSVALADLAASDHGDGVELVVGLVGGLPRDATSFHQAGLAELLGKYAVLRTAARFDENVAVEKGFSELSDEERSRLLRDRARHRAVAVLLHEVGHVLGAMHEADQHSLMNPRYDTQMQAFSLEATEVMHITVSHRAEGATVSERDDVSLATELLAYLAKTPNLPWVDGEREAEVARLEAMKGGAAPAIAASSAVIPSSAAPDATPETAPVAQVDPALAALPTADRARYDTAVAELGANHVDRAWSAASPLFARYPDLYAVQDLRCQLAILRRFDSDRTAGECAAMKRLKR
jgi:Matrixin